MGSTGIVRKYGDAIDTDVIIPARYLTSRDPQILAPHCMEGIDPDFSSRINQGDVLVAGQNFGCGSSREHAVIALQGAGIACVVAVSFARIFYRNSINQGFPILICPEAVAAAREGQTIAVNLADGVIGLDEQDYAIEPFPDFLQGIISAGGIVPFVRMRLRAEKGVE